MPDETTPATAATDDWLTGYRWALRHLTDPGVLRDAARYADERGGRPSTSPEARPSASGRTVTTARLPGSPRTGPQEAGHMRRSCWRRLRRHRYGAWHIQPGGGFRFCEACGHRQRGTDWAGP